MPAHLLFFGAKCAVSLETILICFFKKLSSSNLSSFYRLHEEIQMSRKACGSLDSLLLDIDFRYV